MSREYAERRIKEAIKKTNGNAARAKQQVIAWTIEDTKLLDALTRPHLTGIVAYNIERIMSGRSAAKEEAPVADKPPTQEDEFGIEILKAVAASDAAVFGQEGNAPPMKRGRASKQHIDAIRQMTGKSKPIKK
ncbi:MAG: hypothetical protein DHS20C02_02340 [Micavibrio sp.]|nr:MAG: hypothetical protein DHS20C02_02340 [Micavibrio sp.]